MQAPIGCNPAAAAAAADKQYKVAAIVTDTVMKSLWAKVEAKYPKLVALPCYALVLNLFMTRACSPFIFCPPPSFLNLQTWARSLRGYFKKE